MTLNNSSKAVEPDAMHESRMESMQGWDEKVSSLTIGDEIAVKGEKNTSGPCEAS